jgi:hypothetical protein
VSVVSITALSVAQSLGASALKTWSLSRHGDSWRRLAPVAACRPKRDHLQPNLNAVLQVAELTPGVV